MDEYSKLPDGGAGVLYRVILLDAPHLTVEQRHRAEVRFMRAVESSFRTSTALAVAHASWLAGVDTEHARHWVAAESAASDLALAGLRCDVATFEMQFLDDIP